MNKIRNGGSETMTSIKKRLTALSLLVAMIAIMLTGCDLFFDGGSGATSYDGEMEAATGKWLMQGDADTYFDLDGSEGAMTLDYYEDGALKYSGKFRAIYRDPDDARTPLTFIVRRDDKELEDRINCYTEGTGESFTQFCIMCEEEDLGYIDGTVYTHVYRLSEMPFKAGTYVLESEKFKPFKKTGFEDNYYLPEGTYVSAEGQSLTVFPIMRWGYSLFRYENDGSAVEGIFNIAEDRKTVYLYIEHDIYEKIRNVDKENYDTTFSQYYPPDFYLRGDFDTADNSLIIDGLYHHTYSPTKIEDDFWAFGAYVKE